AQISPKSKYVKMVQADDAIFPECVARMVDLAERQPSIGIVASYWLNGEVPRGAGVPRQSERLSGRDACRKLLLYGCYFLGSTTTVLYRADIVRARKPFYALGRHHEDTEAAFEIMLEHDLGFVHQILSFLRTGNVSIMSSVADLNSRDLDYLIVLE